jgi:succinyl-CoA synthetase beta subunit
MAPRSSVSRSTPTGRLIEAEINPLIVRDAGAGVVAVDALVRFTAAADDSTAGSLHPVMPLY